MATLYEYYNTGDNGQDDIWGTQWDAQTFTPSIAHKITSVKLKLYRQGLPDTITVGITATDINGHPTGSDLCSGTIDGNTLTDVSPGEWYEITLGAGYNLIANTKYAIVVKALSGDAANCVSWRYNSIDPTYAGGCYEVTYNSGSTWEGDETADFMFEEWGEPLANPFSRGYIIG